MLMSKEEQAYRVKLIPLVDMCNFFENKDFFKKYGFKDWADFRKRVKIGQGFKNLVKLSRIANIDVDGFLDDLTTEIYFADIQTVIAERPKNIDETHAWTMNIVAYIKDGEVDFIITDIVTIRDKAYMYYQHLFDMEGNIINE